MTSTTFIVPSVIVPVLSKHRTLARASISMEYRFLTSVFFLPSLITPTDNPTVINRYMPAGIIPVSAPLVLVTESVIEVPKRTLSLKKVNIPTGIKIKMITLIKLFKSLKRLEVCGLKSLVRSATV